MLIDTHAHLDFEQYHRRHAEVIARAQKAGVEKIINVGTSLQGCRDSLKLAEEFPPVYAALGIHPSDTREDDRGIMAEILKLAQNKKVVAIGEIGLDYYRNPIPSEIQKRSFVTQLGLAKRLNLPIIIHNRKADKDILEILKLQAEGLHGVIHCFSGNWSLAKKFLALDFFISFTGVITFESKDKGLYELKEVVKKIPLEKIMVETDCPFLAPEPYRGKVNEPAYVREIAKKIAEIKNIPFTRVAAITTQNAYQLFRFNN